MMGTLPDLSASAVADFWRSWQVSRHLADFCYDLDTLRSAELAAAGDKRRSEEEAAKGYAFALTQIAAFAESASNYRCPLQDFPTQVANTECRTEMSPISVLIRETILEKGRREAKRSLDAYEGQSQPLTEGGSTNETTPPPTTTPRPDYLFDSDEEASAITRHEGKVGWREQDSSTTDLDNGRVAKQSRAMTVAILIDELDVLEAADV